MGTDTHDRVLSWLRDHPVGAGDALAVAMRPDVGIGLAHADGSISIGVDETATTDVLELVRFIEAEIGPRWVWWDRSTVDPIARHGISIARCWDVLTVHRFLHGGWRTSVALVWAWLHGLPHDSLPTMGQLDLLGNHGAEGDDPEQPVRPDGHLRPEWVAGAWGDTPSRMARWAELAIVGRRLQSALLDERPDPIRATSSAHSESAAEFMCAELSVHGLPIDEREAGRIIAEAVGARPDDDATARRIQRDRDDAVLAHLPPGPMADLRNPSDVKAMLRRVAVDVPDTRAWRLERYRGAHPVVDALLIWRKAERIATTYGYRWLDEHVADGRLRGEWASSDGAAGRMTASAGLHNLPAEMRPAVAAEAEHLFVRADLGQIEPRVLAAVSGDAGLIAATAEADMYQPVARQLGVDRDVAKVAVLGAMYGATTGESAHALRGLEREFPTAMAFLERAAETGRAGEDVMTVGGRRIRMWIDDSVDGDIDRARRVAAARGRFARNAVIQGAAAEFFKVWAIIVRARCAELEARVVLCLHDELLVHAPSRHADRAAAVLTDALDEAAYRWSPSGDVRFVADVSVIRRWSEAKR